MEQSLNTNGLVDILKSASPDNVGQILAENRSALIADGKPFARYMREVLEKHGRTQKEVIEAAGFSMKYGYRLLAEERHTKQRDYILRLCFAGGFTLDETQRLLKLYGMSPLYARIPRDAVLISCLSADTTDIPEVNRILCQNGAAELGIGEA